MNAPKSLRRMACLLLCFAMLLQPLAVLATGTESAELMVNGIFADTNGDGKADGWSYYTGSAAECPSTLGEDGITINADSSGTPQRLTVHQTVNVTAGTTYRLTGRYQVTSTASGSLEIRYNAGGPNQRLAYHTSKTDGWQRFDLTFTGCEKVKVETAVSSGATMTVQIRSFSLTEVVVEEPEDDNNLIVNPTYETTDISAISGWNYYPAYASNAGTNSESLAKRRRSIFAHIPA